MNGDLLRATWARVAEVQGEAVRHFYATLFVKAPDVRSMFPVSMAAQNDKLLAALAHIVSHVTEPEVLGGFLARLGADHTRFYLKEVHYTAVGRALLSTLEKFLGRYWTTEVRQEWAEAYQLVSELMKAGAADAGGAGPTWWTARVGTVGRPSDDVAVFTAQATPRVDYRAGQSVPVLSPRSQGWRYLSPATAPREDGMLEFHLRAVGPVSTAIVRRLAAGDELRIGLPIGRALVGHADGARPLLLIAGGTGLAPLRAVVDEIDRRGWQRPTTLVYGGPPSWISTIISGWWVSRLPHRG